MAQGCLRWATAGGDGARATTRRARAPAQHNSRPGLCPKGRRAHRTRVEERRRDPLPGRAHRPVLPPAHAVERPVAPKHLVRHGRGPHTHRPERAGPARRRRVLHRELHLVPCPSLHGARTFLSLLCLSAPQLRGAQRGRGDGASPHGQYAVRSAFPSSPAGGSPAAARLPLPGEQRAVPIHAPKLRQLGRPGRVPVPRCVEGERARRRL